MTDMTDVLFSLTHSTFQEAMQFYDTPRNVREAIECPPPNPLGNYEYPTAGPLPVFRKPCGCIMKLTSQEDPDGDTLKDLSTYLSDATAVMSQCQGHLLRPTLFPPPPLSALRTTCVISRV